jgi:integrase
LAPRKEPIRKMPDGRWRLRTDVGDGYDHGKRRQQVTYWPTKADAQAELARIRVAKNTGTFAPKNEITVGTYLNDWVEAQLQVKATTRSGYSQGLEPVVEMYGTMPLQKLRRSHITTLMNHMLTTGGRKGDGRNPRTVGLTIGLLNAALKAAARDRLVPVNVAEHMKMPKSDAPVRAGQAWTPDQARAFLRQVADDRYAAAWWLTMFGLRRGEVLGLAWADVDLDGCSITVRQSRVVADGGCVITSPKNGKSRTVPIGEHLAGLLRSFRTLQARERLAAGAAYTDTGLVVVNEIGVPVRPETYGDLFHKHAAAAGLPRIRLHDARHSAASLLASQGTPIIVAAGLLGHHPNVYASTYAHLYPEDKQKAIGGLEAMLLAGGQ